MSQHDKPTIVNKRNLVFPQQPTSEMIKKQLLFIQNCLKTTASTNSQGMVLTCLPPSIEP